MNGVKTPRWTRALLPLSLGLALLSALPAAAQLNVRWVEFENQTTTRLVATPSLGVLDIDEKDQAWGDVDKDGDIDLVVVRKQPFTSPGKRPNVLFMNEGGVLTDRTAQYASDSDVVGDHGFLTPTNDRDVVLADFNGDGWLDIATAVTISDGDPKHISHPRIYINKGAVGGVWQGFRFEANRSPQLYVLKADGTPDLTKPTPGRFCSIAAGDVDNDGDMDLYLGDYDSSGDDGVGEPAGIDINDRLWINNGNGFFTDSYETRMTKTMLLSAFSTSVAIADMNGDGLNDIVKDTALNTPQKVAIAYNKAPDVEKFDLYQDAHTFAPYFTSVGDLNNDGRLDIVVTDDNADRYRLNTGNDAVGQVIWSGAFTFAFPTGATYADDGFGSQSLIVDLDRDGFKDVIISDVDVDIDNGGTRRAHIYHNLGNVPNVTLREEAELTSATAGWKGAVGFTATELQHTVHVAAFDIDNDGDNDIVLGRIPADGATSCVTTCTSVWINKLCRLDRFGTATTTSNSTGQPAKIAWTGTAGRSDNNLVLRATGLPPGASGQFLVSRIKKSPCVTDGDGKACVDPSGRRRELSAVADANGVAEAALHFDDPLSADLVVNEVRYIQFRYADPSGGPNGYNWSDALDLKVCR